MSIIPNIPNGCFHLSEAQLKELRAILTRFEAHEQKLKIEVANIQKNLGKLGHEQLRQIAVNDSGFIEVNVNE